MRWLAVMVWWVRLTGQSQLDNFSIKLNEIKVGKGTTGCCGSWRCKSRAAKLFKNKMTNTHTHTQRHWRRELHSQVHKCACVQNAFNLQQSGCRAASDFASNSITHSSGQGSSRAGTVSVSSATSSFKKGYGSRKRLAQRAGGF